MAPRFIRRQIVLDGVPRPKREPVNDGRPAPRPKPTLQRLVIECIYCCRPWTARMETAFEIIGGCDTCDYGHETKVVLDIFCEHCNRLVYRKEVRS